MAKPWCYVAYPDGIERVQIKSRRVNTRNLPRPVKNPILVVNEEGEDFVVEATDLYNNPMQASAASARLESSLAANPRRGPGDEEDEEEIDDEDLEDDDLDDDEVDEDDEELEEEDEAD